MLATMVLVKKVRELAGLNPWVMHQKMGKSSVQSYLSLERTAKRISLEDLFALERIFIDAKCGDISDFRELALKCTKRKK